MTNIKLTQHTYSLTGIIDGKTINYKKTFSCRTAAINYIFHFYERQLKLNPQVQDTFPISKHNIEYVIDYHNRFRISRSA